MAPEPFICAIRPACGHACMHIGRPTRHRVGGNPSYSIRHAISDAPDNRREAFHVHDRCEAYLFISGNAQYLVEGSVYPLERV